MAFQFYLLNMLPKCSYKRDRKSPHLMKLRVTVEPPNGSLSTSQAICPRKALVLTMHSCACDALFLGIYRWLLALSGSGFLTSCAHLTQCQLLPAKQNNLNVLLHFIQPIVIIQSIFDDKYLSHWNCYILLWIWNKNFKVSCNELSQSQHEWNRIKFHVGFKTGSHTLVA